MRPDRLIVALATAIALLVFGVPARPTPAGAQAPYPTRPIEFVIPFAPGGPTDTAIRLIQPQLSANLGVPLVLVNKAGVGNAPATAEVDTPTPHTHTLAAPVPATVP